MNQKIILGALTVAAVAPSVQAARKATDSDDRPNILFIITDQQRWDALGCAGVYPFLDTPNLDKLASQSAYFTTAYTPCAVSGPARSCILSGMLLENNGVLTNDLTAKDPIANNITMLPTLDQMLASEGYYTEYHGKWHAPISWTDCYQEFVYHQKNKNNPFAYELDHFTKYKKMIKEMFGQTSLEDGDLLDRSMFGVPYTPDPIDRRAIHGYDEKGFLYADELKRRIHTQPDNHGLLKLPDAYSLTAYQAKESIAALKRVKSKKEPFAITLSINFPHAPMLPTQSYYRMYDVDKMPVPASIGDQFIDSPYVNQNGRLALPEYANAELIKYMMSNYFGLITEIDYWIGEVLKELDKGDAENTIVVFVSDHGEMLGSHGMREKNVFYEESARVPFIIRYPKGIESVEINQNVTTLDVFSTLADYCGLKIDNSERDSRTLRPLIEGKSKDENIVVTEWLYNDIRQPSHMIVKDGWKLFLNYSTESNIKPVLFNLNEDPSEMVNLVGAHCKERAQYLAKAEELKQSLIGWLKARNSTYADQLSEVAIK